MYRLSLALSNYPGATTQSLFTVQDLEADKATIKSRDALVEDLMSERRGVSTVKVPIAWSGDTVVIGGEIDPPDGASLGSYDGRIVLKRESTTCFTLQCAEEIVKCGRVDRGHAA